MLINNRDGQVLFRRDGKKIQDYYYANGQVLGETGTLSDTNFESHIVGASKMQQMAPGTYTVSNGDTLKGIAQKLWGDASLWYLIADANAIEPTATLSQGMSLTIPTVNSNVHNNDSTFKPYNPADSIGKIDAEAIYVPPSGRSGCSSMLTTLVVVVVAAVVSHGVSAALSASAAGAATSGTMSAGAAAVVGGASGAVAGQAAGQLVSMALGEQSGFDLGAIFEAGARGALAAGVGVMASELSGMSKLETA
ncbi:LysM peptidoglycan-binding domain-containing protein, partial [Vibrio cincinnatiensis]